MADDWCRSMEITSYNSVFRARTSPARTSRYMPLRVFDTADRVWIIRGFPVHWPSRLTLFSHEMRPIVSYTRMIDHLYGSLRPALANAESSIQYLIWLSVVPVVMVVVEVVRFLVQYDCRLRSLPLLFSRYPNLSALPAT